MGSVAADIHDANSNLRAMGARSDWVLEANHAIQIRLTVVCKGPSESAARVVKGIWIGCKAALEIALKMNGMHLKFPTVANPAAIAPVHSQLTSLRRPGARRPPIERRTLNRSRAVHGAISSRRRG